MMKHAVQPLTPMIKHLLCACFCLLSIALSAASHSASLQASVDRNSIAEDETINLTLRYSGNKGQGEPDFSRLEKDFEVLSNRRSNQFQSINGQVNSFTDWTVVLLPRKKGTVVVPSFRYGGQSSDPITIAVIEAAPTPAGKVKDIFIETVIEKDSVYVQEELVVRYKLFYSINIDALEAEPLDLENVIIEKLEDQRYTRKIANRLYRVVEYSYALYPQTSESFTIPQLLWDAKIPKSDNNRRFFGFSGHYEVKRLRTDERAITVKAQPANFPADKPWLPARKLVLQEKWGNPPSTFKVGEPITRTLRLGASGLMAAQLPQITLEIDNNQVKTYADQPEFNNETTNNGIKSQREESAAVVISSPGKVTLPEIRIPWWNITTDKLEYATIAEQVIQSVGNPATNQNIASQGNSGNAAAFNNAISPSASVVSNEAVDALKTQVLLWQIISAALLALLIFVGVIWWRNPRTMATSTPSLASQQHANEKQLFKKLQMACKNNDALEIREALLHWAKCYWPQNNIRTLNDIARQFSNTELQHYLKTLDASIYSTNTSETVQGSTLITLLKNILKETNNTKNSDKLQEFYAH